MASAMSEISPTVGGISDSALSPSCSPMQSSRCLAHLDAEASARYSATDSFAALGRTLVKEDLAPRLSSIVNSGSEDIVGLVYECITRTDGYEC